MMWWASAPVDARAFASALRFITAAATVALNRAVRSARRSGAVMPDVERKITLFQSFRKNSRGRVTGTAAPESLWVYVMEVGVVTTIFSIQWDEGVLILAPALTPSGH